MNKKTGAVIAQGSGSVEVVNEGRHRRVLEARGSSSMRMLTLADRGREHRLVVTGVVDEKLSDISKEFRRLGVYAEVYRDHSTGRSELAGSVFGEQARERAQRLADVVGQSVLVVADGREVSVKPNVAQVCAKCGAKLVLVKLGAGMVRACPEYLNGELEHTSQVANKRTQLPRKRAQDGQFWAVPVDYAETNYGSEQQVFIVERPTADEAMRQVEGYLESDVPDGSWIEPGVYQVFVPDEEFADELDEEVDLSEQGTVCTWFLKEPVGPFNSDTEAEQAVPGAIDKTYITVGDRYGKKANRKRSDFTDPVFESMSSDEIEYAKNQLAMGNNYMVILPAGMGEPLYIDSFESAKEMAKQFGAGVRVIDLAKSAGKRSDFMDPVVEYGTWYVIDTSMGTETVSAEVAGAVNTVGDVWDAGLLEGEPDNPGQSIVEVTFEGYCARLSAPGYLDATEWLGPFASEQEAMNALRDAFDIDELWDEHGARKFVHQKIGINVGDHIKLLEGYDTIDGVLGDPGDIGEVKQIVPELDLIEIQLDNGNLFDINQKDEGKSWEKIGGARKRALLWGDFNKSISTMELADGSAEIWLYGLPDDMESILIGQGAANIEGIEGAVGGAYDSLDEANKVGEQLAADYGLQKRSIKSRVIRAQGGNWWVIAVHWSDGNDASWEDWVVQAGTADEAYSKVCDAVESDAPGGDWQGTDPDAYMIEADIDPNELEPEDRADYEEGNYEMPYDIWTVYPPEADGGPFGSEDEASTHARSWNPLRVLSRTKGAPASWVEDEDIWDKAKESVGPDDGSYDDYWAVVTTVYKNMGGKVKGKESRKRQAFDEFIITKDCESPSGMKFKKDEVFSEVEVAQYGIPMDCVEFLSDENLADAKISGKKSRKRAHYTYGPEDSAVDDDVEYHITINGQYLANGNPPTDLNLVLSPEIIARIEVAELNEASSVENWWPADTWMSMSEAGRIGVLEQLAGTPLGFLAQGAAILATLDWWSLITVIDRLAGGRDNGDLWLVEYLKPIMSGDAKLTASRVIMYIRVRGTLAMASILYALDDTAGWNYADVRDNQGWICDWYKMDRDVGIGYPISEVSTQVARKLSALLRPINFGKRAIGRIQDARKKVGGKQKRAFDGEEGKNAEPEDDDIIFDGRDAYQNDRLIIQQSYDNDRYKILSTGDDFDSIENAIKAYQNADGFWGDVWYQDDHGGIEPMHLGGKKHALTAGDLYEVATSATVDSAYVADEVYELGAGTRVKYLKSENGADIFEITDGEFEGYQFMLQSGDTNILSKVSLINKKMQGMWKSSGAEFMYRHEGNTAIIYLPAMREISVPWNSFDAFMNEHYSEFTTREEPDYRRYLISANDMYNFLISNGINPNDYADGDVDITDADELDAYWESGDTNILSKVSLSRRIKANKITLHAGGNRAPGGFIIVDSETGDDILVQSDVDFPALAMAFGWSGNESDIEGASDFLYEHDGETAEDPGYFKLSKVSLGNKKIGL